MSTKEMLHRLIDDLAEPDLSVAERMLRGLKLTEAPPADLRAFLESCPESEEEETEEERAAVAQSWEEYRRGEVIPHEELVARRKAA